MSNSEFDHSAAITPHRLSRRCQVKLERRKNAGTHMTHVCGRYDVHADPPTVQQIIIPSSLRYITMTPHRQASKSQALRQRSQVLRRLTRGLVARVLSSAWPLVELSCWFERTTTQARGIVLRLFVRTTCDLFAVDQ